MTTINDRLLEKEAYDRLMNWSQGDDGLAFNKQARRDARLVCATLDRTRVERNEQTRLADSAFGKAEQYLQAASVSGEIIEQQRRRIETLAGLLGEAEERLRVVEGDARYVTGNAALVDRIRATLSG